MIERRTNVILYSDGGCRGNHDVENIGGWGYSIQIHEDEVLSGQGYIYGTTNNRMELTAAIKALQRFKTIFDLGTSAILCTDSRYVVMGILEWQYNWKANNWKNSSGKPVSNRDLWEELIYLTDLMPNIKLQHVRGHSGIPGNERADELANKAMDELEWNLSILA